MRENLSSMSLPEELKGRVFDYLEFQWTAYRCVDRDTFLNSLSGSLRSEILFTIYGKMLTKV